MNGSGGKRERSDGDAGATYVAYKYEQRAEFNTKAHEALRLPL